MQEWGKEASIYAWITWEQQKSSSKFKSKDVESNWKDKKYKGNYSKSASGISLKKSFNFGLILFSHSFL